MFDFLNKLSHNHQNASNQNRSLSPEAQHQFYNSSSASEEENSNQKRNGQLSCLVLPNKKRKLNEKQQVKPKRTQSLVAKMQERLKFQLQPAIVANFTSLLKSSQQNLNSYILKNVKMIKQNKEKKVYIRQMSRDEQQYLQQFTNVVKQQNSFLYDGISFEINNVIANITRDIQNDILEPNLFKRRKVQDNSLQALKLIKAQESQLHSKIGELSVELRDQNFIDRRAREIMDKGQFQPENVKTKLAQQFVKELQREKEEKRAKIEQMKEYKRTVELQLKAQKEIQKEKAKEERHLKLIEQFVEKQKAKKQREEQIRTQKLHFQSFLKEFKQQKPLFKKKQEEFQQKLKQQKKERYNILKQKQGKYDPLNVEVLQIHQDKYLQLRKQDRQRKKAQIQLAKHQQKMRKKQLDEKAYKGRFRYLVLQEMVDQQAKKKEKQAEKEMILAKKYAYSLQVKQRFKPTIDPAKRVELQELINSHKGRKRKYLTPNRVAYSERYSTIGSRAGYSEAETEPDPKQEGKRYHRIFKQYIRDKIERGQVRQTTQKQIQTLQPRPNYLLELREKNSQNMPSQQERLAKEIQNCKETEDYRKLILKASEYENKAKQRQIKIRNVPHKPEEQRKLQDEYLCAIKAKIELINNMD